MGDSGLARPQPGALDNLLILDLSRILAGPYCTMILGDYGARVIKIEQPLQGDDTRAWGPPFTDSGESAYFLTANRNKESLTLDLKSAQGKEIFIKLMQQADVLVENFRVGTMDRLGLGYANCHALNPGLIYCAITGYGQSGPYCERPGYDNIVEAQGGIMSITGSATGEPSKVGVAIADITAGLHAAIAILSALHHRTQSGLGQFIDISLLDVQLSWLANVAQSFLVSGKPPHRYGNAHPSIVPYQTMPTADGLIMLAVGNDRQFAKLCHILELDDLADDPLFHTNAARVEHRDHLIPTLEARFTTRASAEWVGALLKAGIPCGPVNDIPTALSDPHAIARDVVQQVTRPDGERVPQLAPPAKLSRTPARILSAPPKLGEHTDALLKEWLDLPPESLAALRRNGVV